MAPQTLTHTGSMTGYVSNGPEARADASAPRAASFSLGAQFAGGNHPSLDAEPLGAGPGKQQQARQEPPDDESPAGDDQWRYTATAEAPGPAYGGAAYNGGGGPLANAITHADRTAIESGAGKVIAGIAADIGEAL